MSDKSIEYLLHIRDEVNYINSVINDSIDKESFLKDETLKRAIVRSLEIIGEATKKIPIDIKLKWHQIQWKNMSGMRDKLIHDYMGINYNIVWDVAKNKIPELKTQIDKVISDYTT